MKNFLSFFIIMNLSIYLFVLTFVNIASAEVVITPIPETQDELVSKMKIENFWNKGYYGEGVNIAVIDSGVNYNHEDLNIYKNLDCRKTLTSGCVENDYKPESNMLHEDYIHGTAVTGVINAQHNGKGLKGIAPKSKLYSFAVSGGYPDLPGGIDAEEGFLRALRWIKDYNITASKENKINIINYSSTHLEESFDTKEQEELQSLITELYSQDVLMVESAGNTKSNEPLNLANPETGEVPNNIRYPSNKMYEKIIVVGGTRIDLNAEEILKGIEEDTRTSTVLTGESMEITAPGTRIFTTTLDPDGTSNDKYENDIFGTSFSAPAVTGLLALYKQAYPNATNDELREMLHKNVRFLEGYDGTPETPERNWEYGYGLAQAPEKLPENASKTILLNQNNQIHLYDAPFDYLTGKLTTVNIVQPYTSTKGYDWNEDTKDYNWYLYDPTGNDPKWVKTEEIKNNFLDTSKGIVLNGQNQYGKVFVNINPDVMPTMTFESWIKPNSKGDWQIVWTSDKGSYNRTLEITPDNQLAVSTGDRIWRVTNADIDEWQHVAVVYTPDKVILYKNGVRFESDTKPIPTIGTDYIQIGAHHEPDYDYGYYTGIISDMRIWNKELSSSELNQSNPSTSEGLVHWWKLNETDGSVGLNYTTIGLNIDFKNNPLWNANLQPTIFAKDAPSYGIEMNVTANSNQYATTDFSINPEPIKTPTIEMWIKPTSVTGYTSILSNDDGSWGRAIGIDPNGNYTVSVEGGNWFTGIKADVNEWQHIAIIYDNDKVYFYKNGIKYTKTGINANPVGISKTNIGLAGYGWDYFKGYISELRIWDRPLTVSELNQNIIGTEAGLKAYWKMNEGIGTTAKNNVSGSPDITLVNNVDWY